MSRSIDATPADGVFTATELKQHLETDKVIIFTDGAAIQNPGPGGYGVVLRFKAHVRELSGGYRLTTNNRMELMACIVGLEAVKGKRDILVVSDSQYVVHAIQKGSARRWQERNWYRTPKEKAKNHDLWERLLAVCGKHTVKFRWVRGHSGQPDNERCDELSVNAAYGSDLLIDEQYEAESKPNSLFDFG